MAVPSIKMREFMHEGVKMMSPEFDLAIVQWWSKTPGPFN